MKKIKKLSELKFSDELNSDEAKNITGGERGMEICGCAGCTWEDGGTGFSLGMKITGEVGPNCNFIAYFFIPDGPLPGDDQVQR